MISLRARLVRMLSQQFFKRVDKDSDVPPLRRFWNRFAGRARIASGVRRRETTIDAVAWYRANSEEKPHPVGSLEPNAWELHDMLGNLWEWTAPWYDDEYPKDPQQDPWGPLSGEWRSIRGGSYRDTADRIRPANRSRGAPENSDALLGFRVVLLSPPAGEGTKN